MQGENLNIVMLSEGIWPVQIGGMQKYSYNMLVHWAPLVNQFILVSSYISEYDSNEILDSLPSIVREKVSIRWVKFQQKGKLPTAYINACKQLSKDMFASVESELGDIDFVYAHGFCGYAFVRQKGFYYKLITNLHGLEMFQKTSGLKHNLQMSVFRKTAANLISQSDLVINLGGRLKEILVAQGAKEEAIITQSVGLSEEWIPSKLPQNKNDCVKFLFIGRYERRKGIKELFVVCKKLSSEKKSFILNFIGELPVEHQNAFPELNYIGEITKKDDLILKIDQSDVLICPSWSEGMPTVILEAMSRGLFIIASDVGATSELVDDTVGVLIPAGSKSLLYDSMLNSINNADQLIKNEGTVQIVRSRYLWDAIILKLNNKLLELKKEKLKA